MDLASVSGLPGVHINNPVWLQPQLIPNPRMRCCLHDDL